MCLAGAIRAQGCITMFAVLWQEKLIPEAVTYSREILVWFLPVLMLQVVQGQCQLLVASFAITRPKKIVCHLG